MSSYEIYITDRNFKDTEIEENKIKNNIKANIYDLVNKDLTRKKSEEEIIKYGKNADALLVQYSQITEKVINNLPKLKVIARYGVGLDVIDINAATKNKIHIVNVPKYCIEEVSDHVLSFIFCFSRKIIVQNNAVKSGNWEIVTRKLNRIKGRTLGLIGFGNIARNLVKKIESLNFQILVYDPYIKKNIIEKKFNVKVTSFEQLLNKSDFISIHVPLTNETKYLISTEEFKKMKETVSIINTSRGSVIEEKALIKALQEKQISGAALDVFEKEPVSTNNPLLKMNNVIVTPHTAYFSVESEKKMRVNVIQGVINFLKNKS